MPARGTGAPAPRRARPLRGRRRWTAGVCGLLCLTLAPRVVRAIESTECATAMTPVQPVSIAVGREELAASRLGLFAEPALSGLHIELVPDAGLAPPPSPPALGAWARAAAQGEAVISTPVRVTITAGLEALGDPRITGQPLPRTFFGDYDTIRAALADAPAEEAPFVTALPTAT